MPADTQLVARGTRMHTLIFQLPDLCPYPLYHRCSPSLPHASSLTVGCSLRLPFLMLISLERTCESLRRQPPHSCHLPLLSASQGSAFACFLFLTTRWIYASSSTTISARAGQPWCLSSRGCKRQLYYTVRSRSICCVGSA